MSRLLSTLFLLLAPVLALAQATTADAPAEQASPATVLVFLVLFIGSIVGYVVWLWWTRKSNKD